MSHNNNHFWQLHKKSAEFFCSLRFKWIRGLFHLPISAPYLQKSSFWATNVFRLSINLEVLPVYWDSLSRRPINIQASKWAHELSDPLAFPIWFLTCSIENFSLSINLLELIYIKVKGRQSEMQFVSCALSATHTYTKKVNYFSVIFRTKFKDKDNCEAIFCELLFVFINLISVSCHCVNYWFLFCFRQPNVN